MQFVLPAGRGKEAKASEEWGLPPGQSHRERSLHKPGKSEQCEEAREPRRCEGYPCLQSLLL